ncbi:MAG: glycine--tRNA ligase subunit beta [bacterium]
MVDALLEIGCEELPASYIVPALDQMSSLADKLLHERMLAFDAPIETAATPRRLVLYIKNISEKAAQKVQKIAGPPERMFRDDNGEYTIAAVGFSKKVGIPLEQLKIIDGKVCAEVNVGGEKAKKILQDIFPEIIKNIKFPKTMVWEDSRFSFARPIRHMTALLGSEVIRFSIADVKSGKSTRGLHAVSNKKIDIPQADKYFSKMENICIRVKQHDRKKYIARLIKDAVTDLQGHVLEDEALLEENTFLVETPSVILGEFDKKYLDIPQELLITCMRAKQKFFTVLDTNNYISARFIGIRNGQSESQHMVREGYERVLTARLEDAAFFYEQDKKLTLDERIEKLKGVTFHEKLGSLYDKVERMKKLVSILCEHALISDVQKGCIKRAVHLCKADLVSLLVYEYPELQGTAGKLYARNAGEEQEVCEAIEEHYKPIGPDDAVPQSIVGSAVSLSDKSDSLAGYFLAGMIPSGNKDPLGMRRLALGIIRTILHNEIHIDLEHFMDSALSNYPPDLSSKKDEMLAKILLFCRQRLEVVFASWGYAHDEINAILGSVWDHPDNVKNITDAYVRLKALHDIRLQPDFEALSAGFKRADNILRQALSKNIPVGSEINKELFNESCEIDLYREFQGIKREFEKALDQGSHQRFTQDEYETIFKRIISLRSALDCFFDKVLVMVDDETLRANRLALLYDIIMLYRRVADFSQIVISGS